MKTHVSINPSPLPEFSRSKLYSPLLAVTLLALVSSAAEAGTIVGGSTLLDATSETQLETWLGQGSLQLTNIFSKTYGDGLTSLDFHAAADGKGATFSLFNVTMNDPIKGESVTKTVGGYNPLSWNSSEGYHYVPDVSDRTAFIFNLSDNLLFRENTTNIYAGVDTGANQTYNGSLHGPAFGQGGDLSTYGYSSLESGVSYPISYTNDDANQTHNYGYTGIVTHQKFDGFYFEQFTINHLEVFTIAAVPEPETYALMLAGLGLVGFAARRRQAL